MVYDRIYVNGQIYKIYLIVINSNLKKLIIYIYLKKLIIYIYYMNYF